MVLNAILAGTSSYRINPYRAASPREFHRSLPGYAPTPLHLCRGLAAELGVAEVYVKDESARFGLNAFKVLGASWAMQRLIASVFSAATAGNHGRAVAWMARRMGARAVIFVPGNAVPARIDAIRSEGAEVRVTAGSYDDAVRQCAAESAAQGWQVISDTGYPGYFEIPGWVVEGYHTIFEEFEEQRGEMDFEAPDIVMVQAGVGGLLCAATQHFRRAGKRPYLVSVEPESAACLLASIASERGEPTAASGVQNSMMAGLNCAEVSLTAWPTIRRGVDLFLAIDDLLAAEAMQRFYYPPDGDPRIVAGESGAAGLAGLLALRALNVALSSSSRVLLMVTEGATDPDNFNRLVGSSSTICTRLT